MINHLRSGAKYSVQSWALKLEWLGCDAKAATHQMFAFGQGNLSMLGFFSEKEHINV